MTEPDVHPTAAKLAAALERAGLEVEVRTLDSSTRTAADAAEAIGCELGQIVKSLVFLAGDEPLLCLCAGDRRVDPARLPAGAVPADPDRVRRLTGYSIGGVPPLGHPEPLPTLVDSSLLRFDTVWAAAGTPRSVFEAGCDALIAALPDARIERIAEA